MFESFKVKQQAAHNLKVPRQAKGKSVPLPKVCVLLHRRAALKTKSKVQRQGHSPCILHPRGPDLHRPPSAQTYVRVAGSGGRRRDVLPPPTAVTLGPPPFVLYVGGLFWPALIPPSLLFTLHRVMSY